MGKKFSDLERASSLNNGDLFAVAQVDAQAQTGYKSKSAETSTIAQKLLKGIEFPTDLQTDDKTVLGAINEVAETLEGLYPVADASGPIANFSTELARPLEALKVGIVATQEAGTPTPSTRKAISGWSNVKIPKCGKNLIDNNDIYNYEKWKADLVTVGDVPTSSSAKGYKLPTRPGGIYTISFGISANNIPPYVYLCKTDGITSTRVAFITTGSNLSNRTYTFTADGSMYYLRSGSTSTEEDFNVQIAKFGYVQLESGSVATDYVIYNGNVINIPLGDTYYGGYVTQDKAGHRQLGVTHGSKLFGNISFSRSNNGGAWQSYLFYAQITDKVNGGVLKCSNYDPVVQAIASMQNEKIVSVSTNNYIYIRDDAYTTAEDFKTANANTQVVYPLAEPIVIDLPDGVPIETLIGVNNIFADSGNILECKYKDTIQHYIDTQIAVTQALIL